MGPRCSSETSVDSLQGVISQNTESYKFDMLEAMSNNILKRSNCGNMDLICMYWVGWSPRLGFGRFRYGSQMGYRLSRGISWCSSAHSGKCWDSRRFRSKLFPVQQSTPPPTQYILDTDRVVKSPTKTTYAEVRKRKGNPRRGRSRDIPNVKDGG